MRARRRISRGARDLKSVQRAAPPNLILNPILNLLTREGGNKNRIKNKSMKDHALARLRFVFQHSMTPLLHPSGTTPRMPCGVRHE